MSKFNFHLFYSVINSFVFLLFFHAAEAQNGTVKGIIRGSDGLPLPSASVLLKGTGSGTTSDNNGAYSISAPAGKQTLLISFAGMTTKELDVTVIANATTELDAQMDVTPDLTMVTIIGSRSPSRTRVQTPVPVDVIPISQIVNEIGQVDLNQILNYVAPSFQSARQTIADGTDHVDPAQLRGLGPDQVLVLINGKRRHQSALVNVNGTVNRGTVGTDLSAIPAASIERIEILRDGAAAQYGSDAIAGVINIVLKNTTGILTGSISYGANVTKYPKNYAQYKLTNKSDDPDVSETDGNTIQASLGYGFKIGKGNLNLTGEYLDRKSSNRAGTYTGAVYPNVGGVNKDDSIMGARGETRNNFDMIIGNSDIQSGSVFANFTHPTGDKGGIYVFSGYTGKKGQAAGFYRYPSGVPGAATTYANQVFAMYPSGFLPEIHSDIVDFSIAGGFRTKLGEWNFDISNTYGINMFDFSVENSANYSQFAVPGNKQTSFDAGGLKNWQNTSNADFSKKYDILEGLNVATGLEYRVDAFGITSGEEASYKNYDIPSKAAAGAQVFAGFVNAIGDTKTRNSKSIYLDLEQDLTKSLLVTAALRFEDYSDFGSTFNYKFSARYKFGDFLNLRASHSTGFRAPSMQQKFYAKTNTLFVSSGGQLVPQEVGTFTNDSKAAEILGIPELKQETSKNYSVGLTAVPTKGLEITVDAYQIDIDDRIILTNNFSGGNDPQLKAELEAAGASQANFFTNAIDTRARGLEAVVSYVHSFDGKHSLRTVLAMTFIDNEVKKDDNGNPIIHASPILVNSGQLGSYFNREDQSRIEVANPKSKINLAFNYKYGKFGAMLRFVRFGKVTYLDPTINPANPAAFPVNAFTGKAETLDQTFDAKIVTDLSVSYQVAKYLGLTIGANNLFNEYQDMHLHSGNMSLGRFIYSRRVQQMGFNGSYFFGRLSLNLPTAK
ncbi:TonB-dependent receptor [Flavitalea sp.]|nr:TonB-dependent receptor [Flavitalea sp.]